MASSNQNERLSKLWEEYKTPDIQLESGSSLKRFVSAVGLLVTGSIGIGISNSKHTAQFMTLGEAEPHPEFLSEISNAEGGSIVNSPGTISEALAELVGESDSLD